MTYEELRIESQNRLHEVSEHAEPKLKLEVHPTTLNGENRGNKTPNNPPRVPAEGEVTSPPSMSQSTNTRLKQNSIYSILERAKKREFIQSPASNQTDLMNHHKDDATPNSTHSHNNFSSFSQS